MHDLIIIGAGPAGLACGIESEKADLKCLILDKGCLVNSIYRYPVGMRFFSSAERLEIGGVPFLSTEMRPTRAEALAYYRRVTEAFGLKVKTNTPVSEVRRAEGGFEVVAGRRVFRTKKLIAATGYYDIPNRLGIPGEGLSKVSHYFTEAHPFYKRDVIVVGGGNSAAEAALDLARAGARVTLIHRFKALDRNIKYWIFPDIEGRIRDGAVRALFRSRLTEITPKEVKVKTAKGAVRRLKNDFVFALIGYHPDTEFLKSVGVRVNPRTLCPSHKKGSLESNVPGLYLAGVVLTGKCTHRIFIENCRHHGKIILPHLLKNL